MRVFDLSYALQICLFLLTACGSGIDVTQTLPVFVVGGTLQGSSGPVALSNNGNEAIIVHEPGTFAFTQKLVVGASYSVSVQAPPVGQVCGVANPAGIVSGDVTNILVTCQDNSLSNVTSAAAVLGQSSFYASAPGLSRTALHGPIGKVAINANSVYVPDTTNNRILVFAPLVPANGAEATSVLGQTDFNSLVRTLDANHFYNPTSVSIAGGRMAVVDSSNNRVLLYSSIPNSGLTAANVVLGQPSFTTNGINCGPSSMFYPEDVSLTASGKIVVSDTINSRLLLWNSFPTHNGAPPDVILGQTDANSCLQNGSSGAVTPSSLSTPVGVWTDGNTLITADLGNNRVLIWSAWPTLNGAAANVVVGQPGMTSATAGTSASNVNSPAFVFYDGSALTVSDSSNNRVLSWAQLPTTSGAKADQVLGQSDFVSSDAGSTNNSFSAPGGIVAYDNLFYVTDTGNNRLLVYAFGHR